MLKYDSSQHYSIVLEAARAAGQPYFYPIREALLAAGVEWPKFYNGDHSPSTLALESDITRAWKELNIHPRPTTKETS